MAESWALEHRTGHRWHTVANPVTTETLDSVIAALGLNAGQRALDVGCGKGYMVELLARAGADVVGYDQSLDALEQARSRLLRSGCHALLLHRSHPPPGPWGIVTVIGSADALTEGSVADALPAVRKLLAQTGRLVFADGYWTKSPEPTHLRRLAPEARRMTDLATLFKAIDESGFVITEAVHSTRDTWDEYMSSYCSALISTSFTPDSSTALRMRLAGRRLWRDYLDWQRDHLGFVTLVCRIR